MSPIFSIIAWLLKCYVPDLISFTPKRNEEFLILGEINKWVPMSAKRVYGISFEEDDVTINLRGGSNENVAFAYMIGGKLTNVDCKLSDAGSAVLSVKWGACPIQ